MSATNHTSNYNLPIYESGNRANWLLDFNGAMNTIDRALNENKLAGDTLKTDMEELQTDFQQVSTKADAAEQAATQASTNAANALTIANNATTIAGDAQVDAHAALNFISQLTEPFTFYGFSNGSVGIHIYGSNALNIFYFNGFNNTIINSTEQIVINSYFTQLDAPKNIDLFDRIFNDTEWPLNSIVVFDYTLLTRRNPSVPSDIYGFSISDIGFYKNNAHQYAPIVKQGTAANNLLINSTFNGIYLQKNLHNPIKLSIATRGFSEDSHFPLYTPLILDSE